MDSAGPHLGQAWHFEVSMCGIWILDCTPHVRNRVQGPDFTLSVPPLCWQQLFVQTFIKCKTGGGLAAGQPATAPWSPTFVDFGWLTEVDRVSIRTRPRFERRSGFAQCVPRLGTWEVGRHGRWRGTKYLARFSATVSLYDRV